MSAVAAPISSGRRGRPREFVASVATIMVKELRSRFRGRRAFLVLTFYLAVLALIAYGAYAVVAPTARENAQFGNVLDGTTSINASAQVGQTIFALLSVFQLLMVSLLAPAFTAGAISLEREKQTLDLLISTPMRPGGIVVGKLLSALAFVILLILAGIPVSALVLMYGGASLDDILRQQAVLFTSAITFGVVGLFFSSLVQRTQTATVLTYSTLLVLTIGGLLIWRLWTSVATYSPDNPFGEVRTAPEILLYPNPAVAMIEVVANTELGVDDFSKALFQLKGGFCDGDACYPTTEPNPVPGGPAIDHNSGGGTAPGIKGGALIQIGAGQANVGAALDCPPGAECPAIAAAVRPGPTADILVSNHFWPRYVITSGIVSLLLTLASMRLVGPARFALPFGRWRRAAAATASPASTETIPDIALGEEQP